VSKNRTRSCSLLPLMSSSRSFGFPSLPDLLLGLRLRGRHALFPPRGEEQEKELLGKPRRHVWLEGSTRARRPGLLTGVSPTRAKLG
jgi:hypothetical protein